MASTAKKHFDVLEFVKTSKTFGVNEGLAEYQARQFEQVIDIAALNTKEEFDMRELATKTDVRELRTELKSDIAELKTELKADIHTLELNMHELKTELKADIQQLDTKIERYRFDTLKFFVWTGVGAVAFLGGLLAKGFHWFG